MRKLFLLLGLGLFVLASGCKTQNVGFGGDPNRFVVTGVDFSTTNPVAGSDVTATIHFQGVSGPFNFTVTFGDCVTPATQTVTAPTGATSASLTFTLDSFLLVDDANGKDCSVSVTGTDALGVIAPPVTGTFHVTGIPDQFPTISTVFNAADCSVTATVADLDNDDVVVTVSGTTDTNTPAPQTVTGGNGTLTFNFSPTSIVAGANSTVTFTADDQHGGTATSTATVVCPGFTPAADTLYAIPLSSTTTVGTPVTIDVFTGDPANPFQYMTGVRVVTDSASGFDYDGGSFNVGDPGGAADDVDGFWTNMSGISNGDFLLAPDSFYSPVDAGGGLTGLDFNVTPLGGSDVDTGSGALFNFGATFTTPGTYTLGFQQTNVVNRTYYQDANQAPDYFWGDITNVHAGVPNTITVQ